MSKNLFSMFFICSCYYMQYDLDLFVDSSQHFLIITGVIVFVACLLCTIYTDNDLSMHADASLS